MNVNIVKSPTNVPKVLGILADEKYVVRKSDYYSKAFINGQNRIQFNVRPISDVPVSLMDVPIFVGYSTDLERFGFEEQYEAPAPDRIRSLEDFLQDYLLIFHPKVRVQQGNGKVHYIAEDIRAVARPTGYQVTMTYYPVPVFSAGDRYDRLEAFLADLREGRYVGRVSGISTESDDTPTYLIWREKDETLYVLGEVESHRYHPVNGFQFRMVNLKRVKVKDEWFTNMVPAEDSVFFVGLDVFEDIQREMESTSIGVGTQGRREKSGEIESQAASEGGGDQIAADSSLEGKFLQHFRAVARSQGLLYDDSDLINFHTAVKCSTLVLLAGMSGTGKSRLVQAYAAALGLPDEQMRMIPVRPSWTDDADLIGYADLVHQVYRPADSGLVNVLVEAARPENTDKLYIICFDEMNLARVEHYFSQFLSVMEMPPGERRLRLYNDALRSRLYNGDQYPPVIPIGDNVLFIGTVNLDESTHHFSDKVLDRSNVIRLHVAPFTQLKNLEKAESVVKRMWSFEEYRSFRNEREQIDLTDRELEFFEQLHQELSSVSLDKGVGFRVVRQIDAYLKNLPFQEKLSRAQALDLQVVQRILTKLRGSADLLSSLTGKYEPETGQVTGGQLSSVFQDYADLSDFAESRRALQQKAKELIIYGFAL